MAVAGAQAAAQVARDLTVRAAGGVIMRTQPAGVAEIALVHRPSYDDWTFPKGKVQPGESEEQTALREVEEETGIRCRLERSLGSTRYTDRRGRSKIVHYWLMRPLDGQFAVSREVDELKWVTLSRALKLLSYKYDRQLLRTLGSTFEGPGKAASSARNNQPRLPGQVTARIYLVRHAKAGNRSQWEGRDSDRPLSKSGRKQATQLIERLAAFSIARVVSSPHLRCVQTVAPLAKQRGLTVEVSNSLREGADPNRALLFLRACAAKPTVLCSHGDVVGDVLSALAKSGMAAEQALRWEKGSTWILEGDAEAFQYGRYLPPPL
ncbi:MAG: NUDIX hydrolase [Candidatus Eremiobacteraeota bacterium]|nr:NUDIX hydrolase [Candidatus Eremiobacteraeota bacterium]